MGGAWEAQKEKGCGEGWDSCGGGSGGGEGVRGRASRLSPY